ncbi:MAG: hypothetical protein ACYC8T_09355 [Myxococcaceae bacterium]
MRDFFPDVFDGLGFLPREYGAVQIFVEPVERDPRGRATAEVWLQAAFDPLPSEAFLAVVTGDGSAGIEVVRLPMTDLSGGRAVRWRLPITIGPDADRLCFKVSAVEAPGSERVRANRRQDASARGPDISDMGLAQHAGGGGLASAVAQSAALTAMALPFGYVAWVNPGDDLGDQEFVSSPIGLPVEDMPHGFVARVVAGEPESLESPQLEVMWEPGKAMPRAETAIRRRAGHKEQVTERVCLSCGHRTESARASSCPACGSFF